jgi:hypothetical protein
MFGRLWLSRTLKELENDMNKIITVALVAGGLLLLDSPEATAHDEGRYSYYSPYYQPELHRRHQMPRWLKRDRAFRHWYKHSRLRRHRHLSWHRLFDIYRWETVERRMHRRADRFAWKHDYYRYSDRDYRDRNKNDRNKKRRRRH